jgi:hypothetical protein
VKEIEAPLVEEFVVAPTSDKPLCLRVAPRQSSYPENNIVCQQEHGHQDTSHVSNPYYNLRERRYEAFVWGIDDNGYSFSYAIDLDGLQNEKGRTYTLAELTAELGVTNQEGGDPWSL